MRLSQHTKATRSGFCLMQAVAARAVGVCCAPRQRRLRRAASGPCKEATRTRHSGGPPPSARLLNLSRVLGPHAVTCAWSACCLVRLVRMLSRVLGPHAVTCAWSACRMIIRFVLCLGVCTGSRHRMR